MQCNHKKFVLCHAYLRVMKTLVFALCLTVIGLSAQTIDDCQKRFHTFLNYHGQLNGHLTFTKQRVYIKNQAPNKDWCIYADELSALSAYATSHHNNEWLKLLNAKGCKHFDKPQLDSLLVLSSGTLTFTANDSKPLAGLKIAIDPGHFGTNLKDAAAEQKFLKIVDTNNDTLLIFESILAFQTAYLAKIKFEAMGAEVFLTRQQANFTSFNCSFDDWMLNNKKRTLDSLLNAKLLNQITYKQLMSCNNRQFFWDFFRDYELSNRVNVINLFKPDVTLIIHYNVNEKNAPWHHVSDKNFTMAFIPGAFTKKDFDKSDSKANFARLLLTNQLNRSQNLSQLTVNYFSSELNIKKASSSDASYLAENCLSVGGNGVFSRNLYLCRKVNSVMVYGESLYQDNANEIYALIKQDLLLEGIKTNARILQVANCYVNAVRDFYTK